MVRHGALALASAAALYLSTVSPAFAQGTTKVDLEGPGTVFEGEEAVFYSRQNDRAATPATVECVAADAAGRTVARFDGAHAFPAGDYRVHVTTPGLVSPTVSLHVKALPPPVSPDAPLAQRLANVEICVWDGDHSVGGRILEKLGRFLGPRTIGSHYAVTWALAGRQASRANVDYAIAELARRGYVIDVYSAVHGYPIQLGDGTQWTKVAENKGLAAVRLFYTTACFGARGHDEFLAAGVKSYVAAEQTNFINIFHALLFAHEMSEGETVEQANAQTNSSLWKLAHWPGVNWVARKLEKKFADGDGTPEGFDKDLVDSEPHVFGDGKVTYATDTRPRTPERRESGLVQALGALASSP